MRLAALTLVLVLVTGCAIDAAGEATAHRDEDVPFGLVDPGAAPLLTTTTAAPDTPTAPVCLIGPDGRLQELDQPVPPIVTPENVLRALAPDELPEDSSLRTAVPEPGAVRDVEISGGAATVDLSATIGAVPAQELQLMVAQLVCTLTGLPGVGQVSFTLDDIPTEVPAGDGSLRSGPLNRGDYPDVMP